MLDTMTLTKASASLCMAMLLFLFGGWAAETLYHVESHGEQAYVIDTGEEEVVEEVVEVAFADVFAAADAGAGAKIWRQCSACHKLEPGANGTGPYLHNVVGRDVGAAEGYSGYSGALSEVADVWSPENLNGFLENPSEYAPGTSMAYRGIKDVEDRANLIAYLQTNGE